MNPVSTKKIAKYLPLALTFLIGLLVGYAARYEFGREQTPPAYGIRQGGFKYINPLLECEVPAADDKFEPFRQRVESLVLERTDGNRHGSASVYFRDLNGGQWFGINENEQFSPASLLKVATMIAYFKMAETSPEVLTKKIRYSGIVDYNRMENILPSKSVQPGNSYTIEELIYMMVVHSDNNANSLLLSYIDPKLLDKTFSDLGIGLPDLSKTEDFMSVKAYSAFFRVLFNASYLNKEMSEKALGYLTQVDFMAGLVSGVTPGIAVAHKFGERTVGFNNEVKELHDCGIVYYPNRPYLICVMSKGDDFTRLAGIIREVSHLVYKEIEDQHHRKS